MAMEDDVRRRAHGRFFGFGLVPVAHKLVKAVSASGLLWR
jgi:hypothetical protein